MCDKAQHQPSDRHNESELNLNCGHHLIIITIIVNLITALIAQRFDGRSDVLSIVLPRGSS